MNEQSTKTKTKKYVDAAENYIKKLRIFWLCQNMENDLNL